MEQWTLRRKALAEASDADKPLLASELELWLAGAAPSGFGRRRPTAACSAICRLWSNSPQPGVTPHCANSWDRRRQTGCTSWREPAGVRAAAGRLSGRDQACLPSPVSQQPEILARWFEPGQWRRVEALTRLTLDEQ